MDTVESLRAEVERWKTIQANEAHEAADEEREAVARARREERERCAAVVGTRRAYELTEGAQALARAMDAIRALK